MNAVGRHDDLVLATEVDQAMGQDHHCGNFKPEGRSPLGVHRLLQQGARHGGPVGARKTATV